MSRAISSTTKEEALMNIQSETQKVPKHEQIQAACRAVESAGDALNNLLARVRGNSQLVEGACQSPDDCSLSFVLFETPKQLLIQADRIRELAREIEAELF